MKNIDDRLTQVKQQISELEQKYHRQAGSVSLLAVSKRKPADMIETAITAGQLDFGENYLQEALEKISAINHANVHWHFIGPIQSNKTREIAEHFHWAHTIDRLKIAKRLSEQRPQELPPLNVCIQLNISEEESKSGIMTSELPHLAAEIDALPRLKLRGLMALPKPSEALDEQREQFRAVRHCFEDLRQRGMSLDTLSLGTSGDMEAAIAEGSTIVRIGTALFGARD